MSTLRRALALLFACVIVALFAQYFVLTPENHPLVIQSKSKLDLEASGPGCTPTTCRQPNEGAALHEQAIVQQASDSGSTISCPTYSGPLFRKDNAQFQSVSGAPLPLPYDQTKKPQAATGWLQPFPLSDVKLVEGSAQWRSMSVNLEYLLQLNPDTLLWSWRRNAGLSQPAGARPAGGWEAPNMELRGHFLGHWLSATAMQWASSNDTRLEHRMRYVVRAMGEVASRFGSSGYLSAFPDEFLDRYERIEPVWAPYYTLHKVLAGLIDMHVHGKSDQALDLAIGLAGYIGARVERLVERRGLEHHWRTLDAEFGGVNDVLWKLAGLTGRAEHRKWASLFDKPCFLAPLALPRTAGSAGASTGAADSLTRMHGNTHVPIALGALHRHEVTGEPIFRLLSEQFLALLNSTRTYATGGSTHQEEWGKPNRLGHLLGAPPFGTVHQESCVTHNTHRLATDLFRATRQGRYADFMERLQLNGVMGTQRGSRPGQMLYFYPLGTHSPLVRESRFPLPASRFPLPASRFPLPASILPPPSSLLPPPSSLLPPPSSLFPLPSSLLPPSSSLLPPSSFLLPRHRPVPRIPPLHPFTCALLRMLHAIRHWRVQDRGGHPSWHGWLVAPHRLLQLLHGHRCRGACKAAV